MEVLSCLGGILTGAFVAICRFGLSIFLVPTYEIVPFLPRAGFLANDFGATAPSPGGLPRRRASLTAG